MWKRVVVLMVVKPEENRGGDEARTVLFRTPLIRTLSVVYPVFYTRLASHVGLYTFFWLEHQLLLASPGFAFVRPRCCIFKFNGP